RSHRGGRRAPRRAATRRRSRAGGARAFRARARGWASALRRRSAERPSRDGRGDGRREARRRDEARGTRARASEDAARARCIARHLYEAGDRERAATYFAKSGERRLEGRQLEASARDYARAIALCDVSSRDPKDLAKWIAGLASAVRLVRSAPEAAEMCERV